MVRLSSGALSLCGLLLVLAGCRTALGPWRDLPPPASILSTAEPVWQQLASRRRSFHNLKGLARVRFSTPTQNLSIEEMVVVLQGFDAMRLEGIGPLGQPLFLLITNGQRFSLYTPQDARLVSGTASAQNLSRLFGMALAPATLQYLLLGDVPLATLPGGGELAYLSRSNLYLWEGRPPEQFQDYRIWFEPYRLQPVRVEVTQPYGDPVLRVQYEDFQQFGDVALPQRITIEQPLADRRVVWHYTDVRLNPGVSPTLFRLHAPVGTERIELD
jgi:outer membrane lipoprotein-sorting protein